MGSVNAGPHKYEQEIESRVGQAQNTNKAFRRILVSNKGIPTKDRLTVWKAIAFSKLTFHSASWGTYQQGPRIIHGETKYVAFKYGTGTNLGVKADLKVPPIQQSISERRIGLLKRILVSNSEWLLGLIEASWDQHRGWATEFQKDLKWLARLETGVSPT